MPVINFKSIGKNEHIVTINGKQHSFRNIYFALAFIREEIPDEPWLELQRRG